MAEIYTDGGVSVGNGNGSYPVYAYPPYPYYGNNNGGFFGNGDGIWAILLFAMIFGNGWGGGFGGFGGFGGGLGLADGGLLGYAIGNNATKGDVSDGFNSLHLSNQIEGVRDGVASLSNQICNSTASVNQALTNGFYNAEIANNSRQMANMSQMFNLSSQFADCCCENRLATADLKSTIIQENCQDREVLNLALRDVIASNTANTQAILDKLNSQTLEAKNDEIAQLRQEVLFARGQASQIAQNEQIVNQIYNRLDTCPVGTTPVYGRTPIFTCNNNGCGCGSIQ